VLIRTWVEPTKLVKLVPIDDPNWYHLLVLRSLKKVFQSRWSGAGAEDVRGSEAAEELAVDAHRIADAGLDLKRTLRF
jgi:hypothetical protein